MPGSALRGAHSQVSSVRRCWRFVATAGAALVTRTDELVGEFEFLIPPAARPPRTGAGRCPALSAEETRIVEALAEGEMDVDALIRCCGMSPAAMGSVLLTLEMKKLIRMLPGRMVERVR